MTTAQQLLKVMNLDMFGFVNVVKSSDGFYLGQEEGDIGFNAFIGKPAPVHSGPGLERALSAWKTYSETDQQLVTALALSKSIDLTGEFGIPAGNTEKE